MPRLSVPTRARLPSSLRVEASNPAVVKLLNRLSRASLLSLVLDWLADSNQTLCPPLLRPRADDDDGEDDDDFYPPARSLEALRELYSDMQTAKGSRRDVVDRIVEGDWRHGLTLYQLAMADLQYIYGHPGSIKWSAYRIQRLKLPVSEEDAEGAAKVDRENLAVPRFHPSTFLQNLQAEVLPDVKAHYNFDRPKDLPLLLLRIFIIDSPYNTGLAVSGRTGGGGGTTAATTAATTATFDASRTLYIAFPDASPHVYISRSQSTGATTTGDSRSLRSLLVEGIPKALSRPRERYGLHPTHLTSKNLESLLQVRGAGRGNAAGGGWAVYQASDEASRREDSPLNPVLPRRPLAEIANPPAAESAPAGAKKRKRGPLDAVSASTTKTKPETKAEREAKRRRVVAQARFGDSARIDDGKGVERLDILIEDPFPNAPADAGGPRNNKSGGGDDDANSKNNSNNAGEEDDSDASGRRRSLRLRKSKGRRSGVHLELERAKEDAEAEEGEGGSDDNENGGRGKSSSATSSSWTPSIRLAFHGPHVFAGLRQLVEAGVIDGARMPGWMTGEEGVTIGAVRHGRIRGHQGSGM